MPTILILLGVLLVAGLVVAWETYERSMFVAKVIDQMPIEKDYISKFTWEIVNALQKGEEDKDYSISRYKRRIVLTRTFNELSIDAESLEIFKDRTRLDYTPTRLEWKILQGITLKLLSTKQVPLLF